MHLSRGRLALAIALGAALLSPTKHASAAPARRQSDAPRMSPIPEDTERPAPAPIQAEPLQLPANADLLDFEAIIRHAQANAPAVQIARSRLELGDAAIAGQKPLLPDNPTVWFGAGVRTNQMGRNPRDPGADRPTPRDLRRASPPHRRCSPRPRLSPARARGRPLAQLRRGARRLQRRRGRAIAGADGGRPARLLGPLARDLAPEGASGRDLRAASPRRRGRIRASSTSQARR
jgi:hypothetical protein